jgi:hypothetical protein
MQYSRCVVKIEEAIIGGKGNYCRVQILTFNSGEEIQWFV